MKTDDPIDIFCAGCDFKSKSGWWCYYYDMEIVYVPDCDLWDYDDLDYDPEEDEDYD
jgi:hypothetical protein